MRTVLADVGRAVWGAAATLAAVLALPALLLHPKLRGRLGRRLGRYPCDFARALPPGPRVWVHAASAGDVRAVAPVVTALTRLRPELAVVVTTVTNSGHAMATHLGVGHAQSVAPVDAPFAVRGALAALRPSLLVLETAELWPVLLAEARTAGVPVALTDGRLSAARMAGYRALLQCAGLSLRDLALLLMRGEDDVARAVRLGADPARALATGNTKLDAAAPTRDPDRAHLRAAWRTRLAIDDAVPLWVAGSTHAGAEEEAVLEVTRRLTADTPLRLVLAPRYVERAPAVLRAARARGLVTFRLGDAAPPPATWRVCVVDRMGDLASLYHAADVAFVGGSLARRGGHDPLEPARAGAAVLVGPHTGNCADVVGLLAGRGLVTVADAASLERALRALLSDPAGLTALGRRARDASANAGGAAARNAALLLSLLDPAAPAPALPAVP